MSSSAFVKSATYMYAPGLSEFVCVPLPGPPHLLLAQGLFRFVFRFVGKRLQRVISFRFKFRFV